MKRKLTRNDLTEVCSGLFRNSDATIRISVYGKRDVRLYWEGFTTTHEIIGTSITDVIKQYNNI